VSKEIEKLCSLVFWWFGGVVFGLCVRAAAKIETLKRELGSM
jgi:hypothetical protein